MNFLHIPKAQPGDKVAILSPSFAAPGFAPDVHEQAMERFEALTGLIPVEYPTTRRLNALAQDRAADVNAAFADPSIRAIVATIGGDDQITVTPHLDAELAIADPKPFMGYSDNTHMANWLWTHGIPSFYGGSTQVQLGPGPAVDDVHASSLRAALLDGERLELTEPGESEDFGHDWLDPRALTEFGQRETTDPWTWSGAERSVIGRTWGGCVEVVWDILTAGRFPSDNTILDGTVLLLETSEMLMPASQFRRFLRGLGERGLLQAIDAAIVARPPTSSFDDLPSADVRQRRREEQREAAFDVLSTYNPEAVVVVGPPFGHTRPQWIVPFGGVMTVDGVNQKVFADYS